MGDFLRERREGRRCHNTTREILIYFIFPFFFSGEQLSLAVGEGRGEVLWEVGRDSRKEKVFSSSSFL